MREQGQAAGVIEPVQPVPERIVPVAAAIVAGEAGELCRPGLPPRRDAHGRGAILEIRGLRREEDVADGGLEAAVYVAALEGVGDEPVQQKRQRHLRALRHRIAQGERAMRGQLQTRRSGRGRTHRPHRHH